jgi:hypothetical protein
MTSTLLIRCERKLARLGRIRVTDVRREPLRRLLHDLNLQAGAGFSALMKVSVSVLGLLSVARFLGEIARCPDSRGTAGAPESMRWHGAP